MSIRSEALRWFSINHGNTRNKIYVSKYYLPEHSWPKKHVWWPQIPIKAIDKTKYDFVIILCQVAPNKNNFHYLKIPTRFFHDHLDKFHRLEEKLSLYLSADPDRLFIEDRGEGNLDFSRFLIPNSNKQ
jgi:hypothetical protein